MTPTECDKCGAGVPTGARFCPRCGAPVVAVVTAEEDSLPGTEAWRAGLSRESSPIPMPAMASQGSSVEGQARGLQMTTATNWFSNQQEAILSFVVERFDEAGNRVFVVPVELRGLNIQGLLREGQWVRVSGRLRAGTLRAKRIVNLETGAAVTATGVPSAAKAIAAVLLLGIGAFIAFVWVVGLAGGF